MNSPTFDPKKLNTMFRWISRQYERVFISGSIHHIGLLKLYMSIQKTVNMQCLHNTFYLANAVGTLCAF